MKFFPNCRVQSYILKVSWNVVEVVLIIQVINRVRVIGQEEVQSDPGEWSECAGAGVAGFRTVHLAACRCEVWVFASNQITPEKPVK